MASRIGTIDTVSGSYQYIRKKQGRKPQGLCAPVLVRLYADDLAKLAELETVFGYYWNRNDFIRQAVREKLSNSVYTELVKT